MCCNSLCPKLPLLPQLVASREAATQRILNDPISHTAQLESLVHGMTMDDRFHLLWPILDGVLNGDDVDPTLCLETLRLCPNLVVQSDHAGMYPLHWVCVRSNLSDQLMLIQACLNIDSSVASLKNRYGETPLHLICSHRDPDYRSIVLLLKASPEAAKMRTITGKYPIHVLMLNSRLQSESEGEYCIIEALVLILDAYPLAAAQGLRERTITFSFRNLDNYNDNDNDNDRDGGNGSHRREGFRTWSPLTKAGEMGLWPLQERMLSRIIQVGLAAVHTQGAHQRLGNSFGGAWYKRAQAAMPQRDSL